MSCNACISALDALGEVGFLHPRLNIVMKKKCKKCEVTFEAKRSKQKYCGRHCFNMDLPKLKETGTNLNCNFCGEGIYKSKGQIKNSKTGRFFCNRSCSTSYNNSLFKGTLARGYKNGSSIYRSLTLKLNSGDLKCSKCGYNEVPEVLEVHHVNGDRSLNNKSNLNLLCPTCHQVEHFKTGTGRFTTFKKLLPSTTVG